MTDLEQTTRTARRWRLAFFGTLAAGVGGVLAGMQPATVPQKFAPAGGVTWVPDSDQYPTRGRLLGVTGDGKLIESERRFSLANDSWFAWRLVRQDNPK